MVLRPERCPARNVQLANHLITSLASATSDDVHQPIPLSLKPATILTDRGERGGPSHNQNPANRGIPPISQNLEPLVLRFDQSASPLVLPNRLKLEAQAPPQYATVLLDTVTNNRA